MKKLVFLSLIFTQVLLGQIKMKKPFFNGSLNTTFGINQDYTIGDDDNGSLIEPRSILIRTGFGYQFTNRWASSIHLGYDHHIRYGINAIPLFGSLRYNFSYHTTAAYFIEASYGEIFRPSNDFVDGDYYKIGIGFISLDQKRWNAMLRLDFHRKTIPGFENENLDSISIGLGFHFN